MAPQADVIAETIAGLKRTLQREYDFSGGDETITKATNRGNKLRKGARHVREGALAYIREADSYKERVEHAGWTRHILDRNPRRYNEFDEEIDDFSSDEEADAVAAEENIYSGLKLEELLCPLKHPSDLPNHPSLSHAYLSDALARVVQSTNEKLRQEQANLWRAKSLYRKILGDGSWVPCGAVETREDSNMFDPGDVLEHHAGKKRKRDNSHERGDTAANMSRMAQDPVTVSEKGLEAPEVEFPNGADMIEDSDMVDADSSNTPKNVDATSSQPEKTMIPMHPVPGEGGVTGADQNVPEQDDLNEPKGIGGSSIGKDGTPSPITAAGEASFPNADDRPQADQDLAQQSRSNSASATSPPPPPRRMTTRARALAAESNSASHSSNPTPPLSPSSTNTSLNIHPLYLVPDSAKPDRDFGLYSQEAEETRRLLGLYAQKQEECVRGYEKMLDMLMNAERMRQDVLEWCKADGHVGEMSDGEDWYDRQFWGLDEEGLRKGHDEDDEIGAQGIEEVRGKKTRRRA